MGMMLGVILFLFQERRAAAETLNLTDTGERRISAPMDPKRIICLGPGTLRLICYLQAQEKVVGVEDFEKSDPIGRPYLVANPSLAKLPAVGPGGPAAINKEPDLEAVLKVRPQVIFIAYMDVNKVEELQKKLQIPIVLLSYGRFATFDEVVLTSLRLAGKILNRSKRAEEVISFIQGARNDLLKRTDGFDQAKKPDVYVGGIGYRGFQGIESTETSYIPFDWVRAKNLAQRTNAEGHLFVDKERLLSWNPEIIFIDGGCLKLIQQDYGKKPEFYETLRAFKEKRVYVLHPYNWYVTNIDTALADAYAVGKILYPERFKDVETVARADEIYHFLVGKKVTSEMEKDFGVNGGQAVFGR